MDKDNRDLNHEPETEQSESSPKTKKKESELFIYAVKLVVIGILLYVTLNHLELIWGALKFVYVMLKPLLIGALLAMIFNTLMMAISRFITFVCTKLKVKIRYRAIEITSLVLSLLSAVLLIYIIADSIIPQLIESLTDIVGKIQESLPMLYNWLDLKLNSFSATLCFPFTGNIKILFLGLNSDAFLPVEVGISASPPLNVNKKRTHLKPSLDFWFLDVSLLYRRLIRSLLV